MTRDELRSRLRQFNNRMAEGEFPVTEIEAICARLYSGPQGVKYGSVVRGYGQAIAECHGNQYITTIHALNSFIVKASKISKANKLYRGVVAGVLPEWFWTTTVGVYGLVEASFMSATLDKQWALDVAAQGKASIIFEVNQGMTPTSRGADLSWLAQWPHEGECVFPPFTGLDVVSTTVDGGTFCIRAKPSVNLTPATMEELIRKRMMVVSGLCDQLVLRVTHEVDIAEQWEQVRSLHPNGSALKLVRTALQRMLRDISNQPPEFYHDDKALTTSIASAVERATQVGRWATEVQGLVRYLPFTMEVRDLNSLMNLTSFDLSHRELGHHDFVGLCALLVLNTSITVVSLLYNNFSSSECAAFAAIARARKDHNLSLCGIGPRLAEAKFVMQERLKAADAQLLAAEIVTRPALTKLNIDENVFGIEGGTAICDALMVVPKTTGTGLKHLSMSNTGLEAKGAVAMSAVLAAKHCTLMELNIAFNRLCIEGAEAIALALKVNFSLTSLNLHYNNLEDEGAEAIFAALEGNARSKVATLVLSSNEIGSQATSALAAAISKDSIPKLSRVDLSCNSLGGSGGNALHNALATTNKPFLSLSLRSCGLDFKLQSALREVEAQHPESIELLGIK